MTSRSGGFTLVELVIVVAIVGILAAAVLPLGRWSVKRQREYELQENLRILRNAIDRYHDMALAGLIEINPGDTGYPPDLDVLVEGVELSAELPSPLPGVSDEFSATGAGLTGGSSGALSAAGGGGFGGAGGDFGGDPGSGFGATRGGSFGSSAMGQRGALGGQQRGLGQTRQILSERLGGSRGGGRSALGGSSFGQAARGGFGQGGMRGAGSRGGVLGGGRPTTAGRSPGSPTKIVFLRRLPADPFTGETDWGMRCYGEGLADRSWCGRNVFDVYSKSRGRGIDGRPYREW